MVILCYLGIIGTQEHVYTPLPPPSPPYNIKKLPYFTKGKNIGKFFREIFFKSEAHMAQ